MLKSTGSKPSFASSFLARSFDAKVFADVLKGVLSCVVTHRSGAVIDVQSILLGLQHVSLHPPLALVMILDLAVICPINHKGELFNSSMCYSLQSCMYFWIQSLMALNFHPPEIQG